MQGLQRHGTSRLSILAALIGAMFATPAVSETSNEALLRKLEEQARHIEAQRKDLAEQEARVKETLRQLREEQRRADALLDQLRGAGAPPPATAAAADGRPAQVAQARQEAVGQPPADAARPREVAQIFEQPGVLTPRGKLTLEPGLQFGYSSSSRVALTGVTVIPAIVVGLIDVREVKRETLTATLGARYGITNRFEIEAKVPYVYRHDSTLTRPLDVPSSADVLFETSTSHIGDIELTGRYQINEGGAEQPYYVGSLKFKSRTGLDPFETEKANVAEQGTSLVDKQLPTGSGFYSLQPGFTFLLPSDPAVIFGGLSYTYNFQRTNVEVDVLGTKRTIEKVKAGNAIGFNLGLGLALNEKSSISFGYDHSIIGKTTVSGVESNSQRIHLGTLLLGYSQRLSPNSSLNFSLGVGATRDAPDVQLSLRLPMTM